MELKNLEQKPQKETFIFPDIQKEIGEITRVAQKYSSQNIESFVSAFIEKAQKCNLTDLIEEMWSTLENTDSYEIPEGGWDKVKEHTDHYNKETGSQRNWEDLKQKIDQGLELDAPIILKYKGELHLVSGNTRLMVARAAGIQPKVLIVEMEIEL